MEVLQLSSTCRCQEGSRDLKKCQGDACAINDTTIYAVLLLLKGGCSPKLACKHIALQALTQCSAAPMKC